MNRDPIEEEGGKHLTVYTINSPVDLTDYIGMEISIYRRQGKKARVFIMNDTIANLAAIVDLNAAEYKQWLTSVWPYRIPSDSKTVLRCDEFEIPNTILAYWAPGEGYPQNTITKRRAYWDDSVTHLRGIGFKVLEIDHWSTTRRLWLQQILVSQMGDKNLQGLYFWGEGANKIPSTATPPMTDWSGPPFLFLFTRVVAAGGGYDTVPLLQATVKMPYKLGNSFIFACGGNRFRSVLLAATSTKWFGGADDFYMYSSRRTEWYVKEYIKEGDQGTSTSGRFRRP